MAPQCGKMLGTCCSAFAPASGSRTTNSLPLPIPAECASTVPPCISTIDFTSERPMPSPPCVRSWPVSSWTNRWKTFPSMSGAIPIPPSRTETTASPSTAEAVTWMVPPSCHVLRGVTDEVAERLRQAGGVGVDVDRLFGPRHENAMVVLLDDRHAGVDCMSDDFAQVDVLSVEPQLSRGDAADVEKVVDQPGQLEGLTHDRVAHPRERGIRRTLDLQKAGGGDDGRERIAKLVAEDGEEIVLAPIGLAQRFLGAVAFGDVLAHSEHAARIHHLAAEEEPVIGTVRPAIGNLDLESASSRDRVLDRGREAGPVRRRDGVCHRIQRQGGVGRKPMIGLALRRGRERPVRKRQLPGAELPRRECKLEP
jgi:hypothetical protein